VLAHNRDEEKEHAVMTLEWLRRHDPVWHEQLRNYLFTDKPLLEVEHAIDEAESATAPDASDKGDGSLGIGSLRAKPGR
jgi:hypothetical protein